MQKGRVEDNLTRGRTANQNHRQCQDFLLISEEEL